ncbi:MAG: MFS transporter [Thermoplasmata archaeon]|nr:MFS transporter [Thermoplasmata archaeon]
MTSAPNPGTPPDERLDPRRANAVLLILSAIALMVTYVETMVVPAFVRFGVFFDHPAYSTISWILSAYLLVGVASTPILGKLGDLYGKKRVLLALLTVYSIAVTVAGFTPQIGGALGIARSSQIYLLIAVRGVQGIGMAMFPLAFAMIGEEFPPKKVATAQGVVSAMFAAGAALGLAGGAWLTQNFGWQLTYHTVVPFAFLTLALTAIVLVESRHRLKTPLDIPGAASLGGALALFLVGLSQGPSWGWGSTDAYSLGGLPLGVVQMFVGSLLLTAFFLYWEPRSPNPIVDFGRLKQRNILISNIIGLIAGAAMFLIFVTNSILLQIPIVGLNQSVLAFGLISLPTALGMLATGPFLGYGVSRLGPKPVMMLGAALLCAGGLLLAEFNRSVIDFVVFTIPGLVGVIGLFIGMTNVIVLSSKRTETGVQTGMNATFRTLGQSLAPVITTTVIASFISIVPGPVPRPYPSLEGFQLVYLFVAALGAVAFVLSAFLTNFRFLADGTRHDGPATAPAGPGEGASRPAEAV